MENSDLLAYKSFTNIKASKKINDNNITDIREIKKIRNKANKEALNMYEKECINNIDSGIYIIRKLTKEEKDALEFES